MKAKVISVVLLSVALIWLIPTGTPVNNLEPKASHTKAAGQSESKLTAKSVVQAEQPKVTQAEVQPETAPVETPMPEPPVPTTHEELMVAAGIQPKDYGAVDYIVSRESSWNENATNKTSGAHGLIQALPYTKTGCDWSDAVCQLKWGNAYAVDRYGSWQGAHAFWLANHWW